MTKSTKAKSFIPSTKAMFFITSCLLVSIFFTYIGLVNKTVINVVTRERLKQEATSLSMSMGELEFNYITLKNNVTLDLAHERGFLDSSPSFFLARGKPAVPLTYNYAQ